MHGCQTPFSPGNVAHLLSNCALSNIVGFQVIVCAAFYKFTPKFLSGDDQEEFSRMQSPADVLSVSEGKC